MTKYIDDLIATLENRYSVETRGMTTGEWICANTTIRGKPFSFKGYEFQRQIADDMHPNMDVIKISQVGLSEIQQRKMLAFLCRNTSTNGIFSLPNELMYRRFAQTRIQPLVDENRVFNLGGDKMVRSMSLIQVNNSFLHVVNATEGSATSISADALFIDEIDISDQQIIPLFSSRLQNSSWRINQRFSTPTWVNFGIDGTYNSSDQHEYVCKCQACNFYQIPLFDTRWVKIPGLAESMSLTELNEEAVEALDLNEALVVCEKCGSPLDLGGTREWVATYPSRTHARGYRIRPFSTTKLDIPYIVREQVSYRKRDFIRGWYNTVLGEAYTDARARLDETVIKSCMEASGGVEISSTDPVYIGIDMGQTCHLTLGTPKQGKLLIFAFRTIPVNDLPRAVDEILKSYNVINGSCDRHPYTPTADSLREMSDGRILPAEYRGDAPLKPVRNVEEVITHLQVNRTTILDDVAGLVRSRKIIFANYGAQSSVLVEHLRDMIRQEDPEKPAVWIKLTGRDHYFHSLAFLRAAVKIQGIVEASFDIDTRAVMAIGGVGIQSVKPLFGGRSPSRLIRRY